MHVTRYDFKFLVALVSKGEIIQSKLHRRQTTERLQKTAWHLVAQLADLAEQNMPAMLQPYRFLPQRRWSTKFNLPLARLSAQEDDEAMEVEEVEVADNQSRGTFFTRELGYLFHQNLYTTADVGAA